MSSPSEASHASIAFSHDLTVAGAAALEDGVWAAAWRAVERGHRSPFAIPVIEGPRAAAYIDEDSPVDLHRPRYGQRLFIVQVSGSGRFYPWEVDGATWDAAVIAARRAYEALELARWRALPLTVRAWRRCRDWVSTRRRRFRYWVRDGWDRWKHRGDDPWD